MIGDRAREVIANARQLSNPTRIIVNVNCLPLTLGETPDQNPDLVSTTGLYNLTYRKLTLNGTPNHKRYCIRYDFGRGFVKFSTMNDLNEQAKHNEHVRFLLKYTNFDEYMLNIAFLNESMHIPIVFDMCKYDKELRAKLGIEKPKEYQMFYNPYRDEFLITVDKAIDNYLKTRGDNK